jgi:hypothetical protein
MSHEGAPNLLNGVITMNEKELRMKIRSYEDKIVELIECDGGYVSNQKAEIMGKCVSKVRELQEQLKELQES